MREDLRHKTWMSALSFLGSFLVLPVSWLIMRSNMSQDIPQDLEMAQIRDFFAQYFVVSSGVIAVAGAIITGLFGFRYVLRKRMVDVWHSLPVKRSTLFGACYLNGILIWIVPLVLNILLTLVLSGRFICSLGGGDALREVLWALLQSLAVLAAAYLLVYHLTLAAVMLSGNVLNALTAMVILGFGVIAVYGIVVVLFSYNMQTFYEPDYTKTVVYASPLLSAIYMIYARGDMSSDEWALWGGQAMLINLAVAAVLGLWACWLYCRRASEKAEQGICSRAAGALLRTLAGVAAGLCGWQLMQYMVMDHDYVTAAWGCFGLVLAGILTFGMLDIVIHMDFKAFFAHKLQMGLTIVLSLLICFSFYGDWFGYDTYLPEKEEVAGIAVFDFRFTNRYFYVQARDELLEGMEVQDVEAIYAYLESVVEREQLSDEVYDSRYGTMEYELVDTKVMLKNGRSYYRQYRLQEKDKALLWELLASEEYLRLAYCIDEAYAADCSSIVLSRYGKNAGVEPVSADVAASIIRAYNEDVIEDPEGVLQGGGRLLCRVEMSFSGHDGRYLDVYEDMERTTAALEEAGFREWVTPMAASETAEISLPLGSFVGSAATAEEIIFKAGVHYGLYDDREEEGGEGVSAETSDEMWQIYGSEPVVRIADPAEVEELMELVSYISPLRGWNLFQKEYVSVGITDAVGDRGTCYIPMGALPEKYILKFGDFAK